MQRTNTVVRAFYAKHGFGELNPHWMAWKDIGVILAEMKKSGYAEYGCVMNAIACYSYRNATIGSTFVARLAGM